jgi:hypothetical protein
MKARQTFDAGTPAATEPFQYPVEANPPPGTERGEVLRGLLEFIGSARTARARLLRLETLAMLTRSGGGATTLAEVAKRAGCTPRRAGQVFAEMRGFLFPVGKRR